MASSGTDFSGCEDSARRALNPPAARHDRRTEQDNDDGEKFGMDDRSDPSQSLCIN
jgi:hypothetical protein